MVKMIRTRRRALVTTDCEVPTRAIADLTALALIGPGTARALVAELAPATAPGPWWRSAPAPAAP